MRTENGAQRTERTSRGKQRKPKENFIMLSVI